MLVLLAGFRLSEEYRIQRVCLMSLIGVQFIFNLVTVVVDSYYNSFTFYEISVMLPFNLLYDIYAFCAVQSELETLGSGLKEVLEENQKSKILMDKL
ncbi:hypothetical protein ECANGB1_176 [Enterospora canceri]|uniref:Uncharacterized protein n=1 Tax=Enterospora canceri TaxID=1081671 RepID=A0A1Y1S5R4_9MICR|nr:hypothetical protein ECANGB1_176 [Enterospora canceri]